MLFYLTNLGIYSIIISQLITSTIRGAIYFPIYSAKIAGVKLSTFYPEISTGIGITSVTFLIGRILRFLINPSSWVSLILCSLLTLASVTLIIFVFFIDKNTKEIAKNKIFSIIRARN